MFVIHVYGKHVAEPRWRTVVFSPGWGGGGGVLGLIFAGYVSLASQSP